MSGIDVPVTVVFPWHGTCEYRERAFRWVWCRYRASFPDWKLLVAPGRDVWIKAEAVNPAVDCAADGIVVISDADVWTEGLEEAVEAVAAGKPWAMPHRDVHRLSEATTARVLAGEGWERQRLAQQPYGGLVGGGIVIARRADLQRVRMDPRFIGWGQEDRAHGLALSTLLGKPFRGKAPLVHLYHPPQERISRAVGSTAGRALVRRYWRARHNPALMSALLEEAADARKDDLDAVPASVALSGR